MIKAYRSWALRRKLAAKKKNEEDEKIVAQIQAEAKKNGATLANEGRGGLDPRMALKVFRRDGWKCGVPKCTTAKENIDLDHIGGHPLELKDDPEAYEWLKKESEKGKQDDGGKGLHVLCERHHDAVHSRERSIEQGNEPKPLPDTKAE